MRLRELTTTPKFTTSTDRMLEVFYVPALARSSWYDRGVGFFTSNWLRLAATGLSGFAGNGGKARIMASPKLDRADCAAITAGLDARNDPRLIADLAEAISDLETELQSDTLSALAWMIADGLLDFRVAVPTGDLDGDFHDKFGIMRDDVDAIAFDGSPNDSAKAFRNYEAISVFYSWMGEREAGRVQDERDRFELLWGNGDPNLRVYVMPEAIRRQLIQYTERSKRPYGAPEEASADRRWAHQRDAMAAFLKRRHGILEMATGTGKTRTALLISKELRERALVDCMVVCAFGTDLLDQWYAQLVRSVDLPIFRAYGRHAGAQRFLNDPNGGILLASRQSLTEILPRLRKTALSKALLICDEVHGMGSAALVAALRGRLKPFAYRLGLSATPDRAHDDEGNRFIEDEIGPVIFRYELADAIRHRILCEFDYVELNYEFSDADRAAVRKAIGRHHAKTKAGEAAPLEALYQELARIRKLSVEKLPPFARYVADNPSTLKRCVVFVETAEYGMHVQDILMAMHVDFHTYYADDARDNLVRFANGDLDCLVTCRRISEGIDIHSVNNIVLFSASRARLETVQRLGRCLRLDPDNPDKRAKVVDLVRIERGGQPAPDGELGADAERSVWFRGIAATRATASTPAEGGHSHGQA